MLGRFREPRAARTSGRASEQPRPDDLRCETSIDRTIRQCRRTLEIIDEICGTSEQGCRHVQLGSGLVAVTLLYH